jgi:diguanylate cyclase (GGDEF)-like protein
MKAVAYLLRCCMFLALAWTACAWAGETLVLQLKWSHQFQFAGYYAALAQGYYRAAGLDVRVVEGRADLDTVAQVMAGAADYGVGTSDLLLQRAQGRPVVALAAIFQHSPMVLLTRRSGDGVRVLAGQRVALEAGSADLLAYLTRQGLRQNVVIDPAPHDLLAGLLSGRYAAVSAYETDEPYALRQQGLDFSTYSPRSAGIDFYGDTLFTSQREIDRHPEQVRAFRAASLRGWQYAMTHVDETIAWMQTHLAMSRNAAQLRYEANTMRDLMRLDLIEAGHMNPERWRHIAAVYAELGMLPVNFSLEGFIYEPPHGPPSWVAPVLGGALLLSLAVLLIWQRERRARLQLTQEIAQRREAESLAAHERGNTASLLDALPDLAMLLDVDGRILAINQIGAARFQRTPPQLRGVSAYELVDEDAAERRRSLVAAALAEGCEQVLEDWRDDRFLRNSVMPIFDSDGTVRTLGAFSQDLTTVRQTEQELAAVNRGLQEQLTRVAELQQCLREQVMRDPLTGLFNRRYIDEALPGEFARAKREGYPISVAMIDLDHFKQVNDTYGHQAGDQALRVLADLLRASARAGDLACRYGGEEFLLILPRLAAPTVLARAEAWCRAFAAEPVRHSELAMAITLSIGIATYPEHGATPDALVEQADLALYLAKRDGRNCVRSAPGLPL